VKFKNFTMSDRQDSCQGEKIPWLVCEHGPTSPEVVPGEDVPVGLRNTDIIDANRLYSIKELIAKNGGPIPIGLATIYADIHAGIIPCKRIGRRIFIPGWFVKKLVLAADT
jgi:hypothetical protein